MSELRGGRAGTVARLFEYQLVRMDGNLLISFLVPLDHAVMWFSRSPEWRSGARARLVPSRPHGPWIVRAYYPDGYPGPGGTVARRRGTRRWRVPCLPDG